VGGVLDISVADVGEIDEKMGFPDISLAKCFNFRRGHVEEKC